MLNIINNLAPFFEDCYREIGVREYAKEIGTSPPTASKNLHYLWEKDLLKKKEYRNLILFRANRENPILRDLSKIYWRGKLNEFIEEVKNQCETMILFGSLSKLEAKKESDIDICLVSNAKGKINLKKYEKKLGRKIELFQFKSFSDIKSKELKCNVLNGFILEGGIE